MLQILVVEDERPISNLIKINLTRAGYDCTCVYDGLAAVDALDEKPFDLVLLDIMLPGADDYLTKPFEIIELLARVESVLRRYHKTEQVLTEGALVIDTASRTVTKNGETISLTKKEFDLLLLFVRNKNIALYRETIYERIWGGEYMGDSRTVDLHVQRMRKKAGLEEQIQTVYKVGYRYCP